MNKLLYTTCASLLSFIIYYFKIYIRLSRIIDIVTRYKNPKNWYFLTQSDRKNTSMSNWNCVARRAI